MSGTARAKSSTQNSNMVTQKAQRSWIQSISRSFLVESVYNGSGQIGRGLVLSQLQSIDAGTIFIEDEDGRSTKIGRPTEDPAITVTLSVKFPRAWIRILLGNDIGFAEAYMLGEIDCSNLTDFFRLLLLSSSSSGSESGILSGVANMATASLHRLSNTREQALINAQNHYSLSNEMFAAFLDKSMTYSAPIWLLRSDPNAGSDTLEAAQLRKLRYTIDAARIQSSDHVLEIGTGWGSFAIEAVRHTGCKVTSITASTKQAELANERIREAGYQDRIEVLVCDYRNVPLPEDGVGRYDKVVSIEMIEHVGREFLDTYFACVDRYLKPKGGIGVFQCITIPEARYAGYCSRQDFIQRYIFPGGHLPTVSGLVSSINQGSQGALVVEDVKSVSGHYVRALREWRENFVREWDKIKIVLQDGKTGMSEADMDVFKRKWEYYFAYCEAGFATKALGDVSITIGRQGAAELINHIPF